MLANLISHILIHPTGKIKIENFHVFDIHWLYRMSWYVIRTADVNERNDIIKPHGVDNTLWQTSASDVTALSKTHFQK